MAQKGSRSERWHKWQVRAMKGELKDRMRLRFSVAKSVSYLEIRPWSNETDIPNRFAFLNRQTKSNC
ncbi:MAG: hypothetical protein ABIL44_10410 [candidate division WOR-3 bacterium]